MHFIMNVTDCETGDTVIDQAEQHSPLSIDFFLFNNAAVTTTERRDFMRNLWTDGVAELVFETKHGGRMHHLTVSVEGDRTGTPFMGLTPMTEALDDVAKEGV